MSQQFHKTWLLITALVVGSFGPIFFLGTMPSTMGAAQWSMDLLAWPVDGAQDFKASTTRFLCALTGGFLFGWGICILCLRQWVFDKAPNETRKAVLAGLVAWFVLDSSGSIASGNASNVLFNAIVLLAAVGPLWKSASIKPSSL